MLLIQDNATLKNFCDKIASSEFITVDTEFLREKTYWADLCLIQIADENSAACIDPLAEDIDLQPVFDLLFNEDILKIFHSAHQDIEIFYKLTGKVPYPLFDTQIAAMFCGYGESISYKNLVGDICSHEISKSMQFTDWSLRPLSDKQVKYALSDVTYLIDVYKNLYAKLQKAGRLDWVAEEMEKLYDISNYVVDVNEVWRKIKLKSHNPRFLAILRELAKWREELAQAKNQPRKRIAKDETLTEIAFTKPANIDKLSKIRGLPASVVSKQGKQILEAVKRGKDIPNSECPKLPGKPDFDNEEPEALKILLKALLKINSAEHEIADKIIATSSDIEKIAAFDSPDTQALKGWRYEIFGKDAEKLKRGELSLRYSPENNQIVVG